MPSPFLKRVQRDDLPEKLQDAWQKSMELRGDATFFEVFGNNPGLFDWYTERFPGASRKWCVFGAHGNKSQA